MLHQMLFQQQAPLISQELLEKLYLIATAIIVPYVLQWLTRKLTKKDIDTQNVQDESETFKNISEAANVTIESAQQAIEMYNTSIVNPLKEQVKELQSKIKEVQSNLENVNKLADDRKKDADEMRIEMAVLRLDNARKTLALTYIISEVKEIFPEQVSKAIGIMRGEIRYEPTSSVFNSPTGNYSNNSGLVK